MAFWTEKQIEGWLKPETRMITMPDGSMQPFEMDVLTWDAHDTLVDRGHCSDWLVRLAYEDAKRTHRPFELLFPSIIAYVRAERLRREM